MTERAVVGEINFPSTGFWRSLFKLDQVTLPHPDPLHCDAPVLRHAEVAAVYSGRRMAGDFYEFLRVGPYPMLFVLLDIAGPRADTRGILIAVQKTFRNPGTRASLRRRLQRNHRHDRTAQRDEPHQFCTAAFAVVRRSSVVTTKTWGRCAMPMRATPRGCFG
jgi:hypothetical protein